MGAVRRKPAQWQNPLDSCFTRSSAMIPEPYELFDFEKGSDKLFFIGTTWIVLFLFLL